MLSPKLRKGSRDNFGDSLATAITSSSASSEPSQTFGGAQATVWPNQRRSEQRGREDVMLVRGNLPSRQDLVAEEQMYGLDAENGAAVFIGRGGLSSGKSGNFQKARISQFAVAEKAKSRDSFPPSSLAFAAEREENTATSTQTEPELSSAVVSTTQTIHARHSKMASLLSKPGPASSIGDPSLDPFETTAVPLDRTTFYLLKICRCRRNIVGTP